MKPKDPDSFYCSFCGRPKDPTSRLVVAPGGVYICESCVDLCAQVLKSDKWSEEGDNALSTALKPKEIKAFLDDYVIAQDGAKIALSVAVYNHYKRIRSNRAVIDTEIQKSNILLIGSTGVGKTLLAQTLARVLNVPFAISDATSITEAGYVGEDVENIILKLLMNAHEDIQATQRGIIYLDEVDKLARKSSDNPSITRDVSGEGVQQALLKIIEGTVANVPPTGGRKHPEQAYIPVDTTNILFILGGSFDGLDDIIRNRIGSSTMGFRAVPESKTRFERTEILRQVLPQDLIKYGFIPEFVGRIAVITTLHDLEQKDLVRILTEPKNAVTRQFQELLAMDDIELTFEKGAIEKIAELAMKRKTGARGLRSIIENLMMKVMFESPSIEGLERIGITKADVDSGCVELPECPQPGKTKSKRSLDELIEEAS